MGSTIISLEIINAQVGSLLVTPNDTDTENITKNNNEPQDMMDTLPDEVLLRILFYLANDPKTLLSLARISRRFHRLCEEPKLWYIAFVTTHPQLSQGINYTTRSRRLAVDWKELVLDVERKRLDAINMRFEFVADDRKCEEGQGLKKRLQMWNGSRVGWWEQDQTNSTTGPAMNMEAEFGSTSPAIFVPTNYQDSAIASENYSPADPPYKVQDPLVSDIDHLTGTGILATGKHRISRKNSRSEHRILFWSYPSWTLIRTFDFNLPVDVYCQLTGIQTVRVGDENCTIFTVAIGIPLPSGDEDEDEQADRVDVWKEVRIYRLHEDGFVQQLGSYQLMGTFVGREAFTFSQENDTITWGRPQGVSGEVPNPAIMVLLVGARLPLLVGSVVLLGVKLLPRSVDAAGMDVSPANVMNNNNDDIANSNAPTPTVLLKRIFGTKMSCMHHLRYPAQLNHLIFTGSYGSDNLTLWDWRTGLRAGIFPGRVVTAADGSLSTAPIGQEELQDDYDDDEESDRLFPWGLETTMVLPSLQSDDDSSAATSSVGRGFRLIAVGDNRKDRLEIRVWDINNLLTVTSQPLSTSSLPMSMPLNHDQTTIPTNTQITSADLPYSPPANSNPMILFHSFHKATPSTDLQQPPQSSQAINPHTVNLPAAVPIKYTAYNVLSSHLFMLTDRGEMTIVDVETGRIVGVRTNLADELPGEDKVRGIDVNVVGGREVVVTARQGVMRGLMGTDRAADSQWASGLRSR
ncbi:hypothetical protein BC937DRAFT_91860 [Endogone sp. FLAS-F59071]|nr:hypothetical protein BC937DRAFT_91860 [Endogone sp. FLAS-F59071]|eukprot:RUS15885.1 hypothetical protein BC937DRAFT_91860 [Endogone sp. FLAS-F59071]